MDTERHPRLDNDDARSQLPHMPKSSPPAAGATEDDWGEGADADMGHLEVSLFVFPCILT